MASIIQKVRNRIRRFTNQLHRYDFAPCNNGWYKYGNVPVFGDATTGTIYDPYAIQKDSRFFIFASERRTGNLIRVESADGHRWNNALCVLKGVERTWQQVVNRGCVLVKGGQWHLWYCGMYNGISQIGYAVSNDGIHFERASNVPVLKATEPYEGVSVMNPSVLWDEASGMYRMWYSAGENYEPDVICYAESQDGIHWKKLHGPVITACPEHKWEQYKVGGCHVIQVTDGYEIYYIGYQNLDVARICKAQSNDGFNWRRSEKNLVLSPTRGNWDSDAIYKPTVIKTEKKVFLWYNGRKKYDEYIGFAYQDVLSD